MIVRIFLFLSLLLASPNAKALNDGETVCMVYQCGDTLVISPIAEGIYNESSVNWYDVIRQYHEQGFDVFVDADNTMVDNAPILMTATLSEDTIEYVKNIPEDDCDISSARIHSNRISIYNMTVGMSVKDALSLWSILSYNNNVSVIYIPGLLSPRSKREKDIKHQFPNAVLSTPLLQSDVWVAIKDGKIKEIIISED